MQALINKVTSQHISNEDDCDELLTDVLPCDDVRDASEQAIVTDASTNTDLVSFNTNPVSLSDVGIQNVVMMSKLMKLKQRMLKFKQQ